MLENRFFLKNPGDSNIHAACDICLGVHRCNRRRIDGTLMLLKLPIAWSAPDKKDTVPGELIGALELTLEEAKIETRKIEWQDPNI